MLSDDFGWSLLWCRTRKDAGVFIERRQACSSPPPMHATLLTFLLPPLSNIRGQISEPECSLLFLSATKSLISLTDRIVSDNRQLIVPLLPAYVSKSADSAVQHGCNEGSRYPAVLHAAGILIYPLTVLLFFSMLHLEGSHHCKLSA